jgi:competence protein ComEC
VTWQVLWPARVPAPPAAGREPRDGQGTVVNNTSVAMLLDAGGVRVLLTGDLEEESQHAVLASGADLRADVLKVPHHGSSRQDEAFLRASGARIALVSVGLGNDYGHPAPRTMDVLARLGMTVARTDQAGSVAVVRTADGLTLATSGTTACDDDRCRGP